MRPEDQARENIDKLLHAAGWLVCDASSANIHAARGFAIREFPLQRAGLQREVHVGAQVVVPRDSSRHGAGNGSEDAGE